jgi:hypothetical protein
MPLHSHQIVSGLGRIRFHTRILQHKAAQPQRLAEAKTFEAGVNLKSGQEERPDG